MIRPPAPLVNSFPCATLTNRLLITFSAPCAPTVVRPPAPADRPLPWMLDISCWLLDIPLPLRYEILLFADIATIYPAAISSFLPFALSFCISLFAICITSAVRPSSIQNHWFLHASLFSVLFGYTVQSNRPAPARRLHSVTPSIGLDTSCCPLLLPPCSLWPLW